MVKTQRRSRRSSSPKQRSRFRGIALVTCGLIGLLMASAILAQKGRESRGRSTVAPAAVSASNPSKEYVYVGGRLVATEEPTASPTPTPNYQGFIDGAGCNVIAGWAWDANNPGATVSVDIYDGSTLVATGVSAGMYREDLLNVLGSPSHGFSSPTPASLKNGASHLITVKISQTTIVLGGSPRTMVACNEPSGPSFGGSFDGVGCSSIVGWAWDANDPGNIINVDVYNGSTLLGTVAATQYRQDLADVYGQPFHGFNFPVPSGLRDGNPHTITVKFGGTSTVIPGGPKTLTCNELSGQNLQGSQDAPTCPRVTGYAWDANDNLSTIEVAIYRDGAFLVVLPAQQSSPGIGSGFHGFSYTLPSTLLDGNPHSIQVKFSGKSTSVSNSPRTMTCP